MDINTAYVDDLIAKITAAAEGEAKLDIDDPSQVGEYINTILGLGTGFIPGIGGILSAVSTVVGLVLFQPLTINDIWEALHDIIEKLIDAKIEEYHLKVLRQSMQGLGHNMEYYTQFWDNYNDATTADEKQQAAITLREAHGAFLAVLIQEIPQFQLEDYAVAELPLFALVANIHLTLLADAIKNGKEWGYSDANIQTLRNQFKMLTSPENASTPTHRNALLPGSFLKEAIEKGSNSGTPTKVLDTWRKAYAGLYGSHKSPEDAGKGLSSQDYVSYAWGVYSQGRSKVKAYKDDTQTVGGEEAGKYRAYSDYDSNMIIHVLNYTQLWPFLTGDPMTADALSNLDREIFYGPFGRYADYASWSPSSPPPVDKRGTPITSLLVRGYDDIDGVRIKHNGTWDDMQGSDTGGSPTQLDLSPMESVTRVRVQYGQKLGKLEFVTNKNNTLQNGNARHDGVHKEIAPSGYELTSVTITRYVAAVPPGCEGIILGFRPLLTDSSRN